MSTDLTQTTPSRKRPLTPESRQEKDKLVRMEQNSSEPSVLNMEDFMPLTQPHIENTSSQNQHQQAKTCPCKGSMKKTLYIRCSSCERLWHTDCAGLNGATVHLIRKLESWKCPACFKISEEMWQVLREEGESIPIENAETSEPHETSDLQQEVRRGVKAAIPDIISGIKGAIVGGELLNTQVETWAQVTQRKLIKEVVEETSKTALQESIQLIDANLTEQKKRVRNAVISGVDEDYGGEGSTLKEVTIELLGRENTPHEIVTVKRLGEKKAGLKRPILVVFKSEEAAQFFHNYSRGRNVARNIWVNPDLTRTERDALWAKRDARRKRMKDRLPVRVVARRVSESSQDPAPQSDPVPIETEPEAPAQSSDGLGSQPPPNASNGNNHPIDLSSNQE